MREAPVVSIPAARWSSVSAAIWGSDREGEACWRAWRRDCGSWVGGRHEEIMYVLVRGVERWGNKERKMVERGWRYSVRSWSVRV